MRNVSTCGCPPSGYFWCDSSRLAFGQARSKMHRQTHRSLKRRHNWFPNETTWVIPYFALIQRNTDGSLMFTRWRYRIQDAEDRIQRIHLYLASGLLASWICSPPIDRDLREACPRAKRRARLVASIGIPKIRDDSCISVALFCSL